MEHLCKRFVQVISKIHEKLFIFYKVFLYDFQNLYFQKVPVHKYNISGESSLCHAIWQQYDITINSLICI